MDRHSIQSAIAQTLENYQRCGMRWVENGELPAEWIEAIGKLNSERINAAEPSIGSAQSASITTVADRPQAEAETVIKARTYQNSASTVLSEADVNGTWETQELDDAARQNLFQILDQEIRGCLKCGEICPYRRQTVFGEGPLRPTVCFMGEAPGADEDAQGRPFVGRAGQLLTKIIGAMQLKREEVYILNSLKCRPPGNRTPSPEEILNCRPYVESQLEALRPKYIVCLGSVAVRSLLQRETPVGQMRGRFYQYRGSKVLVTYHPSYLLRNEDAKRLVWEDMQILMRELGIALPSKK